MEDPKLLNPVTCLNKIKNLTIPDNNSWSLFINVLNLSANKEDSKNPNLYGYLVPLGSYRVRDEAEYEARRIMQETGCTSIIITRYGSFFPMEIENKKYQKIAFDEKGNLLEMENDYNKKIRESYENKRKQEEEYMKSFKLEQDENTLQYLKSQYYLYLNNEINIARLEKDLSEFKIQSSYRKDKIDKHLSLYPEHKGKWWELLCKDFIDNPALLEVLKNKYFEISQ